MGSITVIMRQVGLYLLAWAVMANGLSDCPCGVTDGKLECQPGTVTNFPEDLNLDACQIDLSGAWAVSIENQNIAVLKNDAFRDFSHISQVAMDFNQITKIEVDAFAGLTQVSLLILKENNITVIEDGALDHLVNLKFLDLRMNEFLTSYTTLAWTFCANAEMYELLELSDITVYKRFEANDMSEAFCGAQMDFPLEMCQHNEAQMDCTNVNNFGNTPCFLKEQAFDSILFNFPADD